MVLFFYIVMFSIQITVCRSISRHFCSDLSIFDRTDFAGHIPFLIYFPLLTEQKLIRMIMVREFSRSFLTIFTLTTKC
jgi:hypothetical protein